MTTAHARTPLPDDRAGRTRTFRIYYPDDGATELAEALREIVRLRTALSSAGIDPGDPTDPPLPPVMREFQFYVHANVKPTGELGELFIKGDRLGGFMGGALDALAMAMSIGLQYDVPLSAFTEKLRGLRFGPSGRTGDPEFPMCGSMFDLLGQYLEKRHADQIARERGEGG